MRKIGWFSVVTMLGLPLGLALGGLSGCKLLMGDKAKESTATPQPKPLQVRSFTDAAPVTAVAATGSTLWVGTTHGLVKWDLAKNTSQLVTATDGLPGNRVVALAVDGEGALWVATPGGLAHQQGAQELKWKTQPVAPVGEPVAALAVTTDGALWIGGAGGLARFGGKAAQPVAKKKAKHARHKEAAAPAETYERYLGSTAVTTLVAAGDTVWVGTKERGLLHIEGGQVTAYGPEQGQEVVAVKGLTATPSGVMAIGEVKTAAGKSEPRVSFFDGFRFWSYRLDGQAARSLDWLRRIGNNALLGAGERMWSAKRAETPGTGNDLRLVATNAAAPKPAPSGPAGQDPPTVAYAALTPAAKPATNAPAWELAGWGPRLTGDLTAIGADGPVLYVGTRYTGAARVDDDKLTPFRRYDLVRDASSITVACQAESDCWLTTGGDKALHYDGNSFEPADIDAEAGSRVMAVVNPPNGGPLAFSRGKDDKTVRLAQVTGDHWQPVMLRDLAVPAGLPDVTFAAVAPTNRLWLGLRYIDIDSDKRGWGAAEVDLARDSVVYHRPVGVMGPKDSSVGYELPSDITTAFFRGADEAWFGLRAGVAHLLGGKLTAYTDTSGIGNDVVHALTEGPDGYVWAATRRGVAEFDGKKWLFPGDGDPLKVRAMGLVRDRYGSVYVGSDAGILLCSPATGDDEKVRFVSEKIDSHRGLADDHVVGLASDRYGRVWAITEKALSIIER